MMETSRRSQAQKNTGGGGKHARRPRQILPTSSSKPVGPYAEMAGELMMSLRVLEKHFGVDDAAVEPEELIGLYRGLFARFDRDGSGEVDRDEFRTEMREVMLAVANGLGFLPVQMVVEEGSFLKFAVDRELGQLAKAA